MRKWLMLSLGVMLAGCARSASLPPNASVRFLALGDSYTIGESVDESARWPVQLAEGLRKEGIDVGMPTIIARTGWTTADLSRAMDQANPKGPYDLVGLLIGVNNQFQGRSEEEYHQQFVELLRRAIDLAGGKPGHVIVLSIPDWGVTPFGANSGTDPAKIAAAIDRFNAINKSETLKAGVAYVDITPVSRAHREMVADDGLHPSEAMYGEWVKLALPAATTALRK